MRRSSKLEIEANALPTVDAAEAGCGARTASRPVTVAPSPTGSAGSIRSATTTTDQGTTRDISGVERVRILSLPERRLGPARSPAPKKCLPPPLCLSAGPAIHHVESALVDLRSPSAADERRQSAPAEDRPEYGRPPLVDEDPRGRGHRP